MMPEEILSHKPKVLTQAQREQYFASTALLVLNTWCPKTRVAELMRVTNTFVEASRTETESGSNI